MSSNTRTMRWRRVPVAFAVLALTIGTIGTVGAGTAAAATPVPVKIGGPFAADWVTAGATAGIGVTLVATPANQAPVTYAGSGADPVFDALDRDNIGGRIDGPFGLGVLNSLISTANPGVTSVPSEIGYYGNSAICGEGKVLSTNCADQLAVTLGKSLYGGSFEVTFFYGGELPGETLKAELYRGGVLQDSRTYGPADNGSYNNLNPGRANFTLPDVYWDEIRFIGDDANVADATDFLVEFVSGDLLAPELGGDTATGSGTKILARGGNWFMYNTYPEVDVDVDGDNCWDLQAGNPKDGVNIVGEYCIVDNGGTYTATYDIDDTITIGGFVYDIEVVNEHLAISDTMSFKAVPGTDDNQDFFVPFTPTDGTFYVFAHFSIDYV